MNTDRLTALFAETLEMAIAGLTYAGGYSVAGK